MSGDQQNSGTSAASAISIAPAMSSPVRSGASRDGQGAADDGTEGEEQEESSSSSPSQIASGQDTVVALDTMSSVREQCCQQMENTALYDSKPACTLQEEHNEDFIIENMAKSYFLNGIEFEQKGKFYEAIQSYRRAVQLIPDIETRLYEATAKQAEYNGVAAEAEDEGSDSTEGGETDDYHPGEDLMAHLQRVFSQQSYRVCAPASVELAHAHTHMSALPMEIMLYILRWVVSSDLDLRALEVCSQVCRGFYVCCRDTGIWKLACARIWGSKCKCPALYGSWRRMFIERPRLQFNGCYISRTTYVRHGENSFQDRFYRPWHVVEYYRYLRFFPEGRALMLTSSEDPQASVSLLRCRTPRHPSALLGHYLLAGDAIVVTLHQGNNRAAGRAARKRDVPFDLTDPTFRINLQIRSSRNHIHGQLAWKGYTISRSRAEEEISTHMDLSSNKYPPFWFSRVKSYTSESETPL